MLRASQSGNAHAYANETDLKREAAAHPAYLVGPLGCVTRYWLSEADFCAAEQARALEGFDEARVPPDLRPLIDTARRYGVGDDACRRIALRRLSRAERARLRERVHA